MHPVGGLRDAGRRDRQEGAAEGKEEGDAATVTTPNGSRRFDVVKRLTIYAEA